MASTKNKNSKKQASPKKKQTKKKVRRVEFNLNLSWFSGKTIVYVIIGLLFVPFYFLFFRMAIKKKLL
jgi:hypothetical protein